ncbi:basic helix-loop-helix ARNT-like protein 1 isoform X3 [Corticium candelabrum]|nr:basic helix-loop-helix ARNT-like protein 1 isoform X3 [Corticium candelabrum]
MSSSDVTCERSLGGGRRKRKSSKTSTVEPDDAEDSEGRDPSDGDGTEKQRETHNQIEKRRREKMNTYINELSALVPECVQTNKRMDKLTVLKLAVRHLRELRGNPLDDEQLQVKPQFLADDELKYLILEAADGFLFVVGCEHGKLIYVSDSISPILKQSEHDWMGKEIYEVIHPRDVGRVKDQLVVNNVSSTSEASDSKSQSHLATGSRRSFFCRMRCGASVSNRIEEQDCDVVSASAAEQVYYVVVHVTG